MGGAALAPPATVEAPAFPTARGVVRPVAQAKIGTLLGGIVNRIAVAIGQSVVEGQEIARIVNPNGATEVLVAPWRGTITDIPVHVGDICRKASELAEPEFLAWVKQTYGAPTTA